MMSLSSNSHSPQIGNFDDWRRDGLSPMQIKITASQYDSAA